MTEEQRKTILQEREDLRARQDRPELRQYEVEKSPEALELLHIADNASNDLLQTVGRQPLNIPPECFHVLNEAGWQRITPGEHLGTYRSEEQAVYLHEHLKKDPVLFALSAYHEMLHFKSYQAFQKTRDGDIKPYRIGLMMDRKGKETYFKDMDEAIVQTLTNRYVRDTLAKNPMTKEAFQASERRRQTLMRHGSHFSKEETELLDQIAYLPPLPKETEKILGDPDASAMDIEHVARYCRNTGLFRLGYVNEIKQLDSLVNDIADANPDTFRSKEEVFHLFVSAVFTGAMLPLGKIIEKTFGKGSLRRLGRG